MLVSRSTGERRAVRLRAKGSSLVLTPDHKVWARVPGDTAERARRMRSTEPGWAQASDVKGGYVNHKLAPTEPSLVAERVWWIVGRWLADGHIDKRNVAHISCGKAKLQDLLAALGDTAGNPRWTGTAWDVPLKDPSLEIRSILKTCGHGAADKHLPPEGYTLEVQPALALLRGYLSGDGNYLPEKRRWSATTVSEELSLGISYLAQRALGVVASRFQGRSGGTSVIQGRLVNTRAEHIVTFVEGGEWQPLVCDDGAWKLVRSVEDAGVVPTWNLRVEEDESFTAEGMIVKNCPMPFGIVDRVIERFSNRGDLVYDPFAGIGTVPRQALLAGRRARGVELNPAYWAEGVRYCQAAERKVETPSLFDLLETVA